MKRVECATQADMERAIADGARPVLIGDAWFRIGESAHVVAMESAHVEAWGSAHVVARESAHVEAWGSAHVVARESAHVEAWGSAHVVARESAHVEAWGSAHVEAWGSAHVVAWGSAHVVARESAHVVARESAHVVARGSAHVVARESAHVVARESAHVEASRLVAVHRHNKDAKVQGGVLIEVEAPTTAEGWADFYGVSVVDGVATVYKAVRADLRSSHKFLYEIGATPEAPDWEPGRECGGGLHFSPHPLMALAFDIDATRFIACPVALDDMRAPRADDTYQNKIKARRICGPIVEVDRHGKPLMEVKS